MEERAQELYKALIQNTEDCLADRIDFPTQSERCKELWEAAQTDPALYARVQELVQAHCMREMAEAMKGLFQ